MVTDHQEDERERQSNQSLGLRAFRPDTPSQSALYIRKEHEEAQPCVGQLDRGLCLSPQRLRSHKAIEIKHLFPREHVVHRTAELVGEHRERFSFAVFTFQFRKILFAGLIVA